MNPQTPALELGSSEPCGTSCTDTVELLPWLLNGSLDADERHRLREHLTTCEACRRELEETARVWQIATRHLPSLSLTEYALGLAPNELSRDQIERHLAVCPSCRKQAELTGSGEILDFDSARTRSATPATNPDSGSGDRVTRYRRLAIAATVAVVAAGAIFFGRPQRDAVNPAWSVNARAFNAAPFDHNTTVGAVFLDGFESGSTAAWSPSTPTRPDPSDDAS